MTLPVNIESLIDGRVVESDRIEFKKGWNPDAIYRTICAFANDFEDTSGGYIVVGVEEENGRAKRPVCGVDINELDNIQKSILNTLVEQNYSIKSQDIDNKQYDFFISHASEDKEDFVKALADGLTEEGCKVWYDNFVLKIGDSLRESIDRGLANSKYGIVVISPHFLKKRWPAYELNGMVAREMNGHKVILPIWHKVTKDEILQYSPTLADKLALNTAIHSIKEIIEQLKSFVSIE